MMDQSPFTLEQQKILVAFERKGRDFQRAMIGLLKGMVDMIQPKAFNAEKGMLALRTILVERRKLISPEEWDGAIDAVEEQEAALFKDSPEIHQLNTEIRDLNRETVPPEQYADRCECRDRRDEHALHINPSPEVNREGFALFGWFRWGACLKCPCEGFRLVEVVMDYSRSDQGGESDP